MDVETYRQWLLKWELDAILPTCIGDFVRRPLTAADAHGGTSFRDYRDSNGAQGRHVQYLQVYGRGGMACYRCSTMLCKISVGGRATVYCPHCQR